MQTSYLQFTPAEFLRVYVANIEARRESDPDYKTSPKDPTAEVTARRMMAAILKNARFGGTNDWLKYNAALKSTAKCFGFTKSMELRAAFNDNAAALDSFLEVQAA